MAFVSATLVDDIPRFQVPAFSARQARRLAGAGLALGLGAGGVVAVLAVSLAVASVWTRAVSFNTPSLSRLEAPTAPLSAALGAWHRSMIRSAVHSGPASGFGTAPDTEPQTIDGEIDLAPVASAAPRAPLLTPKPAAPTPRVRVPTPRPRPTIHLSEAAPVVAPPPLVVPPVVAPSVVTAEAEPVPLPLSRPRIAAVEPEDTTGSIPRVTPVPAPEPKMKLASLPPPSEPDSPASAIDRRTAVYDIASATVYMPNGRRLEAHSGLGRMMDDPSPQYIRTRMRGPTPPNVYQLTLREQLFHGVRAIRLTPVDEKKMYGRDGMLAHTYMLGPNGQSNGCVSFKNYDAFLQAFLDGEVKRMVVVPRLDAKTREALALPAPKWGLLSAFAE
jgi:hypothetical protein